MLDKKVIDLTAQEKMRALPDAEMWFDGANSSKTPYLWENVIHFDGHGDLWKTIYSSVPKPHKAGAYVGMYDNLGESKPAVVLLYEGLEVSLEGQLFIVLSASALSTV